MKKIHFYLFILNLLFFTKVCFSEPELSAVDYKCFSLNDNQLRWEAKAEIDNTDQEVSIYKISEEAKGFYSGYDDQILRRSVVFYEQSKDYNYKPLTSKTEFFDTNNNLLLSETQSYDYENKKVFIESRDFVNNKIKNSELEICGPMTNKLMLALQIRKFLMEGKQLKPLYFVSSKPALYKINFKLLKEEDMEFNNKKLTTHKILLDPDIGIFNILKFLLSNTYVWYNSKSPYEWLKFEGLETDLGSQRIIVETAKVSFRE